MPNNLHTLQLGNKFNQKLENLPDSLHTLTLEDSFNKKLEDLPHRLVLIKISKSNNYVDVNHLSNKYILDIVYFETCKVINIKGRKGMFTKSSNKL